MKTATQRYALYGAVFGLLFPIVGTALKMATLNLPANLASIYSVHSTEPVLWIIDTAPLFLGIFAAIAGRRQDYLKKLNDELNVNKNELENAHNTLEQQVKERTTQLENAALQISRRALRLQAIAEISQNITINIGQDLQDLLLFITRAISEKTGYYHTGIFLLNENREYAVLRAANSPGGKRMLDRHHQLRVGGTGIVGYVSQGGRPRIASDTGTDAVFFDNPDLPGTRSEMALPLKVESQVIGVLDIQSDQSSAFIEDDVTALSTLANQIAIIIQNKQLMEGERTQILASKKRFQLNRKEQQINFSYLPDGSLSSAADINNPMLDKALATSETVVADQVSGEKTPSFAVPVKLRDQVIGVIHVEAADGKRKWTEDEISLTQAISEHAALALENASLFEATERRAEQEQVIAEITSRIGESSDMERILQTTIQELGRTLGATRTFIQMGAPSMDGDSLARQESG